MKNSCSKYSPAQERGCTSTMASRFYLESMMFGGVDPGKKNIFCDSLKGKKGCEKIINHWVSLRGMRE